VADQLNHRVQKVAADGAFLAKWGTQGSADGQFSAPMDVALDTGGNVYVVDGTDPAGPTGNDRVQKFDASGSFITKWGGHGGADGQLSDPRAIEVDSAGNVYVADAGNSAVKKFDASGNFITKWGGDGMGDGQFQGLKGLAIDAGDFVYTVEDGNRRVQKFTTAGTFVSKIDLTDPEVPASPWALDVATDGSIYVVGGAVRKFAADGTLVEKVPCRNTAMTGVTVHPSGKIYVGAFTEHHHDSLMVFGEGGAVCQDVPPPPQPGGGGDPGGGTPGTGTGLTFHGREGVTVDAGAAFTNQVAVELTVKAPDGATEVRVSNDGGFLAATTKLPNTSGRYTWRLDSSGPERLPKTVYVRFAGPGGVSPVTFSDDIILDQTPPQISQASLSGGGAAAVAVASRTSRYSLRMRASDNVSGVAWMQLAVNKRKPAKPRPFRRRLDFRAAVAPRYVRVRDKAGNWSRWRKLRAAR
jgi:hypothetical protein